jgi:hypothetical protein
MKARQEGDSEREDRHEPNISRAKHIRRAASKAAPLDWQKAEWLRLVREINAARAVIDSLPKGAERTRWKQSEREAVKTLCYEMEYPDRTEFTFDDGTRVEFADKDLGAGVGVVQTAYPRLNIFPK